MFFSINLLEWLKPHQRSSYSTHSHVQHFGPVGAFFFRFSMCSSTDEAEEGPQLALNVINECYVFICTVYVTISALSHSNKLTRKKIN